MQRDRDATEVLATALWDSRHTVRLSEHPEESEAMRAEANAVIEWLRRSGWKLTLMEPSND